MTCSLTDLIHSIDIDILYGHYEHAADADITTLTSCEETAFGDISYFLMCYHCKRMLGSLYHLATTMKLVFSFFGKAEVFTSRIRSKFLDLED